MDDEPTAGERAEQPPVVLVTGAGRGLGRGVALELARSGCTVVLNFARDTRAADEAAQQCAALARGPHQQFLPMQADVGVREQRAALLQTVLERLGRLDGLVNNAGMAPRVRADITEATEESFEELLRVNLRGPYFLTQAVARYWLGQRPRPLLPGGFKVLFITSVSASAASLNRGEYCISKAGLSMAARLWAARLAGEGIQVVELRPGIMATDMTRGVRQRYDRLIAEGLVPAGRWGTPEDVGRAAAAVLRGELPYAEGAIIDLDGGLHVPRL